MVKKRIMYLHTGAELYGADKILLTIVEGLDKNKFEPIVVLPNDGPLVEELKKQNIRVEIISYPILRRKYFNLKGIIRYLKEYKGAINKLTKFARKEKIDIIHNNTIAVLEGISIKKKQKNIKLITHVHEILTRPKIIASFLYSVHIRNADKIICVSNAVKEYIENMTNNDFRNVIVVHNGIKAKKKIKSDIRKKYEIPKESKLFAIIGRINHFKGQTDFVNAISLAREKDKNIYGIIVGDAFSGQEWRVDSIKKMIKDKGLSNFCFFTGFEKNTEKVYSAIDALVLPSTKPDPFPTVVLESISCGVPVIAYKDGGAVEMIKNDIDGWLVQDRQPSEIARIMVSKKFSNYNDSSKNFFEKNFGEKEFIERMQKVYEE